MIDGKIGWDGKKRFCKADDPGDTQQEKDTYSHGQGQAHVSCLASLTLLREFVRDNGDKYNIVNSQNYFQKAKGDEGNPGISSKE